MTGTVELPIWLVVVIVAFAAVTFASHFLFPSVRWFFRRRMERAVARLNKRLARPIEPFKLARRHDTIQRLIYDPEVMAAVAAHAAEQGIPRDVAHEKARAYAREIVPSFSTALYFGLAMRLARWLAQRLYRVRVPGFAEAELGAIPPDATVIFVINHRSNMDYVLVTYLAAERSALAYAVGEWARIWPLSSLIRMLGGYFIRRRSRDALYRKVLARYVQIATAEGVTQAVFPEGGLSLDGRLAPPRLGILAYVLAGFDPAAGRDVVFVPVAVNYDRVLEDRVLTAAWKAGERRFGVHMPTVLRFVLRMAWRRLRHRFHRFGYAAASFGPPLSLQAFLRQRLKAGDAPETQAEALGAELMARIGREVPVLPVPLVAHVLRSAPGPLDRAGLQAGCDAAVAELRARGAHVHVPRGDLGYMVGFGLRNLCRRRIAEERAGGIAVAEGQGPLLDFYANSIAHLFAGDPAAGRLAGSAAT